MRDLLLFALYSALLVFSGTRMRFWSDQARFKWAARKIPMQVNCGWCSVILRHRVPPITHGICDRCADQLRLDDELDRAEQLAAADALDPREALDDDGRVVLLHFRRPCDL